MGGMFESANGEESSPWELAARKRAEETALMDRLGWGTDGLGDLVLPGLEQVARQGSGLSELAKGGTEVLGPLGFGVDVISAGMGARDAVDGFRAGDADAGWQGVGKAANGTIGALLTPYPAAAAAFAGYGIAADGLGGLSGAIEKDTEFSADSMTGGMLRGMWGDESIGGQVSAAMGGGWPGWLAGTATNVQVNMLPGLAQGLTAGRAAANWAGNMIDDDETRDDHVGELTRGIKDALGSFLGW
jgi:hypothetical protein